LDLLFLSSSECAHLLLAHNAPVKVKNAQGWSPLAEAISYGDRQMSTLGDFYLELHWDFQSWVPLLSRILPSDACKIYKQGINIRLDTTLIDFTDMKCQRGDLSFIFCGDAAPSESFVVLDNEQKVYQRIHHEARAPSGHTPVRRQSLTAPSPNTISWEEYITAETGKAPHLGRELVCKESKKNFKATVAMSQDFPLSIESLLNVLEIIAPFKHFNKLREFVQMKLPPGFPVKLDIPVFPTITATVTFQEFRYDQFHDSIFTIPNDYKEDPSRFPDL
ncbi:ankyrin repeat domain-containing protein 13C, partial [Sinocyclocheilus grahami]|uniref:ankyrin repeat domain-containing protein 13C n=1 Tax=Sinocyclocheilus grahami TaxID=75366 RepID=UPI0007AD664F